MNKEIKLFIYKIRYPILLLLSLWVIEAADTFLHLGLSVLGIYPRELSGLPGIFTAPFIHATWGHLASNSIPMIAFNIDISAILQESSITSYHYDYHRWRILHMAICTTIIPYWS